MWPFVLVGGCGCFVVVAFVLGAIVGPLVAQTRAKARERECVSGMNVIAHAVKRRAADHGGALPDSVSWMDALHAYTRGDDAFRCPAVSQGKPNAYGKAFNSALGGRPLAQLQMPATDVMVFDSTNLLRNASDPGTSLPAPPRHLGHNVMLYLDGHVKAMPISTLDPVR